MILGSGMLCLSAATSTAAIQPAGFEYDLNASFAGAIPGGSAPWVVATFQNDGSAGVILTISGTDLAGSEKLDQIFFNVNPADGSSIANLDFSKLSSSGSFALPTITKGEDAEKSGGDGYYDVELAFATGKGVFQQGDSISYLISGISGLTASDFVYASTHGGGAGTYYVAAHILSTDGGESAWVDPAGGAIPLSSTGAIPEPAFFGFYATAMAVVVAFRFKRSLH